MQVVTFGSFVLDPKRRTLSADGQPVDLQSRPFDILEFLVAKRDQIVSRDEIIAHVWQGLSVAENNLTVQMSILRRTLGDHGADSLIITLPGRGYRFVGDVAELPRPEMSAELERPSLHEVPEPGVPNAKTPRPPEARTQRRPILRHPPLIVLALLALGLALAVTSWRSTVRLVPPRLSIVVMPFRNLSDDRTDDYLADNISDDLTTDLAHIPGSLVIARETADSFKGRAVPADEVGRRLNVRYLLEGSLFPEGTALQVNAQLIETSGGTHLWSERFPVPRDRLNEAADDVVRHIASVLNVQLETIEAARSLRERPDNPDALDMLLRARAYYHCHDDLPGIAKALGMLERAQALSPDFVDTLIMEGQLLVERATVFDDPDDRADLAHAIRMIDRAASLAPGRAEILVERGYIRLAQGDIAAARASFEAALADDPNLTRAHMGLAISDWRLGRYEEDVSNLQVAMQEDPLGPAADTRRGMLAMAHFMLRRIGDAKVEFLRVLMAASPEQGNDGSGRLEWYRIFLIASYAYLGELDAARQAYQLYSDHAHNRTVWRILAEFSGAQAATEGHALLRTGLAEAGMQLYADEHHDDGATPASQPRDGSDYEPTPTTIPGGTKIDTVGLRALMAAEAPVVVVDVGRGAAVMEGALWEPSPILREEAPVQQVIDRAAHDAEYRGRPVIAVGTGTFGRDGYNAALRLIAGGLPHVFWFRGGEEAWAAAGLPAEDRRTP